MAATGAIGAGWGATGAGAAARKAASEASLVGAGRPTAGAGLALAGCAAESTTPLYGAACSTGAGGPWVAVAGAEGGAGMTPAGTATPATLATRAAGEALRAGAGRRDTRRTGSRSGGVEGCTIGGGAVSCAAVGG
jgi:hypothetical protein